MKRLLNFSTHEPDIKLIAGDWAVPRALLGEFGFDGLEMYPVTGYDLGLIPQGLVLGLHMRFLIFLDAIWHGKVDAMRRIFGDLDTARHFFGGLDRDAVVEMYQGQLTWAAGRGAEYAVFHASQADLDGLLTGDFPWTWRETVDTAAEVINAATAEAGDPLPILFENLWWPGGLRLDTPREVERLLSQVEAADAGLALDTGHVLNKNPQLRTEEEAIDYLVDTVAGLGSLARHVRAVHLSRSLSGPYAANPGPGLAEALSDGPFWDRFAKAQAHVSRLDQHDAFEHPGIRRLFDLVEPEYVVYEFSFSDMAEWRGKIERQNRALAWPT